LKPARNNCLLPGVLVLCNIAQVAENGVSLSDSWRRSHNVRQQNAASIVSLMLTTEVLIADAKGEGKMAAASGGMGGSY